MVEQRSAHRGRTSGENVPRLRRAQSDMPQHSKNGERLIAGVPAPIMRPRLVFVVCLAAILGFGLLMVYSASSVEALKEYGSSTFFLKRQAIFMAFGLAVAAVLVFRVPKRWFDGKVIRGILCAMIVLLLAVLAVGRGSRGATRWLNIAGFQFQPSEFAKPILIVFMSRVFSDYYNRETDWGHFMLSTLLGLGLSLVLIFIQPDLGTSLIIFATIIAMALMAGMKWKTLLMVVVPLAAIVIIDAIFFHPYRLMRYTVSLDPFADEFGDGYQAALAVMAFASGGLFGRGIGGSTFKYNYLPEAHNDYILAIVGEELGFVGTFIFFAVFLAMIYAAFMIAARAADKRDGLMASGCAVILCVQFLINALGILNIFPMTGKPLPFISYGGSAIVSCILLAGIILRVSIDSNRKSVYDERRQDFALVDESTAGTPHVRSERRSKQGGFSVLDGFDVLKRDDGVAPVKPTPRKPTPRKDTSRQEGAAAYRRVDLNSDPTARLRVDDGSHVRGRGTERGTTRRDRHDR